MKIVTSLSFPGNCREAFDFYAGVPGGEITAAIP
jgi:PhnB protein